MELPIVKLGDICDFQNGFAFKSKLFTDSGVPILRISNIQSGSIDLKRVAYIDPNSYKENLDRYRVVDGDLLIAMSGATTGKVGLNNTGIVFLLNQRVGKFVPSNKLDKQYLFYYLSTQVENHLEISAGSAQPNLSTEQIKGMSIPLPNILAQKRIVAILDQAFADLEQVRAKTEQNLKNARELFDSYLQQVFNQRGDGWKELNLESIVSEDCSLSYGIVQPGDDFNGGLPVVRPTDLKVELITSDDLKLIDPAKSEGYKRTVLQGGELLVCVRGSTGITSIACKSLAGANVTRGIVPVRFNPEFITSRFGYYQFISPLVQSQIKDATYGAALMQINIRDFRKIRVSTPSIEIQESIVNKLDSLRPDLTRTEEIYKQKLLALDELKKSILQKAFSGELTAKAE